MATPYASMLLESREGEAAVVPARCVQGRAQADRRRPSAILYRQPRPLHDPRAARAAHRHASARSRSRASPPPTRRSRLITTRTRRPTARRKRAPSARRWSPTRRPRTRSPRGRRRRDARCRGCSGGQQRRGHHARATRLGRPMPASPATRSRLRSFSAASGAVVGPIQSDFGWVVVKVDSVKSKGGKTARSGARRDRRQAERRQAQGGDRGPGRQGAERDRRRQQLHRGSARRRRLPVTTTPLITASGSVSRRPDLPAAARTRPGAQDRLRDRAQRPAGDRHAAERRGLCAGLAGAGRCRRPPPRSPASATRSRPTGSRTRR